MRKVFYLALWAVCSILMAQHANAYKDSQAFDGFCLSIFDGMSLTKMEKTINDAGVLSSYQYAPGMYGIGLDVFCSKPIQDWLMGVGASWTYNFNHDARIAGTKGEQTMHKKNDISAYVKVGYAVPRILFYARSGYIATPFTHSYNNKTETSQGILAAFGLDIKLLDNLVFGLDVGCAFYRKVNDKNETDGTSSSISTQSLNTQFKIGWLF